MQRANRQSSFGPTCRLVSSPEAGPGATVGTQNQGYLLLQYEGTVSMRLSLVARQTTPNPTTWAAPGPPRGQRRRSTLRCQRWVRTPTGSTGPLDTQTGLPGGVQNPHKYKPDPWDGVRATHRVTVGSRDSKEKNTQALIKAKRRSGADTCPNHTASAPTPRSGGDPMLPRGLLPVA
jgi:hypothetical protein